MEDRFPHSYSTAHRRVLRLRISALWFLVTLAAVNRLGGAVITAIPLGFLPFVPELSWHHYMSHMIYGVTQLPLVLVSPREAVMNRHPLSLE